MFKLSTVFFRFLMFIRRLYKVWRLSYHSLWYHEDFESYMQYEFSSIGKESFCMLMLLQRINHFAGMGEICRKDSLARNMWR